jgi:hypothetical protein
MYRKKSKIIEQIQSYHRQVAKLYFEIYEKVDDKEIKSILLNLYQHERSREEYLEKHKIIAETINCWLHFPCDKLSNQITDCFKEINIESNLTMKGLIKLEVYFDNCLIKLYNILASENAMNEQVTNIFYYMLKKTKKEEEMLSSMLSKSESSIQLTFA